MQSFTRSLLAAAALMSLSMAGQAEYLYYYRVQGISKAPDKVDCSTLPSNYAGLCKGDTGAAVHAKLNGTLFALDVVTPDDAYRCSTGWSYANDYQAAELAPLVGQGVYTPYQSYYASGLSRYTSDVRGQIMQINPDLSRTSSFHYLTYSSIGIAGGSLRQIQPGTREALQPGTIVYYSQKEVFRAEQLNPAANAYRACRQL